MGAAPVHQRQEGCSVHQQPQLRRKKLLQRQEGFLEVVHLLQEGSSEVGAVAVHQPRQQEGCSEVAVPA